MLLPLIDQGRALGLDLTFDTYPYLAGSTILGMVALPPWVQEGGIEATVERLADPADPRPPATPMVLAARPPTRWTRPRSRWWPTPTGDGPRA